MNEAEILRTLTNLSRTLGTLADAIGSSASKKEGTKRPPAGTTHQQAFQPLYAQLKRFTGELETASDKLGSFSAAVSSATDKMQSALLGSAQTVENFSKVVGQSTTSIGTSSTTLSKTVEGAAASMEGAASSADKAAEQEKKREKALDLIYRQRQIGENLYIKMVGKWTDRLGLEYDDISGLSRSFSNTLREMLGTLGTALQQVVSDIFHLQSRGIAAADSLGELYFNAARFGMSLQEYTQMLEDNSAVVTRMSSLGQFDESLRTTTKSLNRLGIFGPAAANLSATMQTAAVTVGVPMSQMGAVVQSQVKTFENLRKTTFMTAEGFKTLVNMVAQSADVQDELIGLAPAERAARYQQLVQTAAIGHQMGLTKDAADRLAQSLLAMRKATAVERFRGAASVRQAAAVVGMDPASADELAGLIQKKNKTPEEMARFVELGGQLKGGLESLQNSGNIGMENIADQLESGPLARFMEQLNAAAGAQLQQQAGQAGANKEMGKNTSEMLQALGNFGTALTGFLEKNPFGQMLVQLVTMAAATIPQILLLNRIARAVEGGGGGIGQMIDGDGKGKGPGAPAGGKKKGIFSRIFSGKTADVAADAATEVAEGAAKGAPKVGGGLVKNALSTALKATGIGAILVGLFDGITELFTGNLGAAFGIDNIAVPEINFGEPGWILRLFPAVYGKLEGFVLGVLRGIPTGLLGLLEGLLEGFNISVPLVNMFDQAFTQLGIWWAEAKLGIYKGLNKLGKLIGVNIADDRVKELEEQVKTSKETLSKLEGDSSKTLTTIGEENKKVLQAQRDAAKEATKETKVLGGNIVSSVDQLATAASSTVRQANAVYWAQQEKTQVMAKQPSTTPVSATPAETRSTTVNSADINKQAPGAQTSSSGTAAVTEPGVAAAAPGTSPAIEPANLQQVIAVLQAQLDVLNQTYNLMANKEDPITMFDKIKRSVIPDNTALQMAALNAA